MIFDLPMDFINKLILLLSGQGLILAFLIYMKKKERKNLFIGLYLFLFSGILIYWYFAYWDTNPFPYIQILRFDLFFHMFLGPLLYIIVSEKYEIKKHLLISCILGGLFLAIWIYTYITIGQPEFHITFFRNPNFYLVINFIGLSICIWYFIKSLRLVDNKSNKLLTAALGIYILGWLANFTMSFFFSYISAIDYLLILGEILLFYGAGYYILIDTYTKANYVVELDELHLIMPAISNMMLDNLPYLDPSFSIKQMAEKLNIHHKKLSQILNQGFKQNFSEFVNSYRIEKAKEMLLNEKYEKHTVLEILWECGFNSKSAFNVAFKKFTSQSPLEFKKSGFYSKLA